MRWQGLGASGLGRVQLKGPVTRNVAPRWPCPRERDTRFSPVLVRGSVRLPWG